MLKACCDCIAGNQRNTEDPYSIQLNGNTNVPPWPKPQLDNENMFLIAKQLNRGDEITVFGNIESNGQRLDVSLITGYNSPDSENIACQFDATFLPNDEGKIEIKTVQNGFSEVQLESNTSDYFGGTQFNIRFKVRSGYQVDIYASDSAEGDSYVGQIKLKHAVNDIRFMAVSGDIEKVMGLNYKFG